MNIQTKRQHHRRRHRKVRSQISGTKERPRLFVFRSNAHVYATLVNDEDGYTIHSVSDKDIKGKKGTRVEISKEVGKEIAKKATTAGITSIVFDRGGYAYHGNVKAVAEGAREGGLQF